MPRADTTGTLRVLLLADDHPSHASTLLEHIDALRRLSRHDVHVFNPRAVTRSRSLALDDFDVVVVHYSLMILSDHYLSPSFRAAIARFRGIKVQFIQDDYRQVAEMWQRMRELGIDILFTLVPERELDAVWPPRELPGVRRITTLAGYVPSEASAYPSPPLDERPLEVGYRGRSLPPWLGILGQEKAWIAQGVAERAERHKLRCDVAWTEGSRIYGLSWFEFIASCRVTLGTESGATITDFDGTIERRGREYMIEHPEAEFWDIHEAVLAPYEGNVRMNVISPRIFEAVALRTGLVLFPGEYSGVLERDRHYIPLEKDFSNFAEVVERIRDTHSLEAMVDTAYDEIVASGRYAYATLARSFDDALDEAGPRFTGRTGEPLRLRAARAERVLRDHRPTRTPVRAAARRLAFAKLLAADEKTRRLLVDVLRRRELRESVDAHRLLDDLIRLAVIRKAHAGRIKYGPAYTVSAMTGERGTKLVSVMEPVVAPPPGELRFPLTFFHGNVDDYLVVPLTRRFWASVPAGAGGGTDHEFSALALLAERAPAMVAAATAELVTTPATNPATTFETPQRLPLPLHVLRFAPHYARKARHLAPLINEGQLLNIALHTPRPWRDRAAGLVEIAKLELLCSAAAAREIEEVAWVEATIEGDVLVLKSRAGVNSPVPSTAIDVDGFNVVRWDHREVGPIARLRTDRGVIEYALAPDGVLEVELTADVVGDEAVARKLRRSVVAAMEKADVARSLPPRNQ